MNIRATDLDYYVITALMIIFFLSSFKRRKETLPFSFTLDKELTTIVKGVSCVMILMSHHFTMNFINLGTWNYPMIIGNHAANVALVLFMFLSGYGITCSYSKKNLNLLPYLKTRVWKVYEPLLFICIACTAVYWLLPDKSLAELTSKKLPLDIYYLHCFDTEHLFSIVLHSLGCFDWFVYCISIFYIVFWLSVFISKKFSLSQTKVLFAILAIYYICGMPLFGEANAHYYRLPWAFWLGNFVCSRNKSNFSNLILMGGAIASWLPQGVIQIRCYTFAVICIAVIFILNRYFVIKNSTFGLLLLTLGNVSYFYYLTHIRFSWVVLSYIGIESVTIWAIFNFGVAYLCNTLYQFIKK